MFSSNNYFLHEWKKDFAAGNKWILLKIFDCVETKSHAFLQISHSLTMSAPSESLMNKIEEVIILS